MLQQEEKAASIPTASRRCYKTPHWRPSVRDFHSTHFYHDFLSGLSSIHYLHRSATNLAHASSCTHEDDRLLLNIYLLRPQPRGDHHQSVDRASDTELLLPDSTSRCCQLPFDVHDSTLSECSTQFRPKPHTPTQAFHLRLSLHSQHCPLEPSTRLRQPINPSNDPSYSASIDNHTHHNTRAANMVFIQHEHLPLTCSNRGRRPPCDLYQLLKRLTIWDRNHIPGDRHCSCQDHGHSYLPDRVRNQRSRAHSHHNTDRRFPSLPPRLSIR